MNREFAAITLLVLPGQLFASSLHEFVFDQDFIDNNVVTEGGATAELVNGSIEMVLFDSDDVITMDISDPELFWLCLVMGFSLPDFPVGSDVSVDYLSGNNPQYYRIQYVRTNPLTVSVKAVDEEGETELVSSKTFENIEYEGDFIAQADWFPDDLRFRFEIDFPTELGPLQEAFEGLPGFGFFGAILDPSG